MGIQIIGTSQQDFKKSILKKIVIMLSTVLILAFGFLGASASSLGVGSPRCDGDVMPDGHVCESDGILHHYADPEDCHLFYDCYNGCLYHRTCPEHENWSKIHGYCDWDYNVDCGADPGPEPGPDDFVCPEAQGVFEDPKNCAKYYLTWKDQTPDRKKRGLEMVTHTLDMMDKGGIHDHVSQGFARYSTDRHWHVPHFEKMLYDQAQLMMAYTAAAQLTGDARFKEVVDDIYTYIARDLTHPSGGFYSAEDADSLPSHESGHKLEGAFCVWSWAEVEQLLGGEEVEGHTLAQLVQHEFHMAENGNVSPQGDPHGELKGQNILTRLPVVQPLCEENKYREGLERARKVLFEARLKRPRPGLDTKILASWNALMVSALARSGAGLKNEKYLKMATRAGSFLRDQMINSSTGTILRSLYGSGENLVQLETPIQGFLEDYTNSVQAMLDLYTATLDEDWLELAKRLQETQDSLFLDKEKGGYFASREGDPEIILRLKDDQDGAEPSANSVAAMNLLRLGKILGSTSYEEEGLKVLRLFGDRLQQLPRALPAMAEAVLFHQAAMPVLVVAGSPGNHPLLDHIRAKHSPSLVILGAGGQLARDAHPALTDAGDEQAVFLMRSSVLGEKISTIEKLQEMLEG